MYLIEKKLKITFLFVLIVFSHVESFCPAEQAALMPDTAKDWWDTKVETPASCPNMIAGEFTPGRGLISLKLKWQFKRKYICRSPLLNQPETRYGTII